MRNGGIGTHNWLLAHLLAGQGWYVHVLYCGAFRTRKELDAVAERVAAAGIGWTYFDDVPEPAASEVPDVFDSLNLELSDRVRHVLEELHAQHRFRLAEFGDWGGLGFRSVQARRTGAAFADLPMLVRLHSSSQWMREGNRQWPGQLSELEIDYLERYSFEHADYQVSPSRYMFDYARSIGWAVRPDARVIAYPYPAPEFQPPAAAPQGPPELVFFGRLETRKRARGVHPGRASTRAAAAGHFPGTGQRTGVGRVGPGLHPGGDGQSAVHPASRPQSRGGTALPVGGRTAGRHAIAVGQLAVRGYRMPE